MNSSQSKKSSNLNPDFLVWAHPVWWILVPYGMYLVIMSCFAPNSIPSVAPLGSLATTLGNDYSTLMAVIASAAVLAHIIEAFLAYKKATRLGIQPPSSYLWGFQVLILGVFAFRLLKKPVAD